MKVVPAVFVLGAFIGCGSDKPPALAYTEAQVIELAGIERHTSSIGYESFEVDGCDASPILLGGEQIDLYVGAGDTVITNPSGRVGIKNGDPACADVLAAALANVP